MKSLRFVKIPDCIMDNRTTSHFIKLRIHQLQFCSPSNLQLPAIWYIAEVMLLRFKLYAVETECFIRIFVHHRKCKRDLINNVFMLSSSHSDNHFHYIMFIIVHHIYIKGLNYSYSAAVIQMITFKCKHMTLNNVDEIT